MLKDFEKILKITFFLEEPEQETSKIDIIEKSLKKNGPSKYSLTVLNEFFELIIFLDQLYKADENQREFFDKFKEPFLVALATPYNQKWSKFSHQTKEFFSLKVIKINFLIKLIILVNIY
jgi:hypothetical protein